MKSEKLKKMRRLSFILFHLSFSVALLSLTSCKDKKPEDKGIITTDYVAPAPTSPKTTAVNTVTDDVEWIEGRSYHVSITGHADNALPMVQDENGQKFIDNSISIEVTRQDSTVFFAHSFTKEFFTDWLSKDYREKAILTDINLLGAEGNVLKFVTSLNYPDGGDDESLDLLLQVDNMGNISIQPFTYNDRDDLDVIEQE